MPEEAQDINDLRKTRLQKIEALKEAGIHPYPERFETTHTLGEARLVEEGTKDIALAGRIMQKRLMGKIVFVKLQDFSGQFQVVIAHDTVGEANFKTFNKFFDIGDFMGAEGEIFVTKKGEISLKAEKIAFLGKAILPLPEKWHGVTDTETRYRKRYLDLVMHPETKARFMKRARILRIMRKYLEDHGFWEVETPILASKASGALAKPFVTHHNALDIDMYLRIAPETYLKRLIVGGYDKVFEFARCFRNEGMDPSHLQDFTMLEYYVSYWNYEDNMDFTERFIGHVIYELNDSYAVTYKGTEIDFTPPFPRYVFRDLIKKDSGIDIYEYMDKDPKELAKAIKEKGIDAEVEDGMGRATVMDQLYKKVSRPKLINPCFVIDHPAELKPLARVKDDNPNLVDSFQLLVNGWEIVNAYSELVDPVEQKNKLLQQMDNKKGGDEEAMELEETYIEAMEHGMPPMSGWGMGIDRFTALLTDQENLKDVVLFPLMRPMNEGKPSSAPSQQRQGRKEKEPDEKTEAEESVDSLSKDVPAPITYGIVKKREEIWNYVQANADEKLIPHLLSVEAAMRALARHFGANEEEWGIAGLLHDSDYSTGMDEHTHCGPESQQKMADELLLPDAFIKDICAHNEAQGLPRDSLMAKALFSVDELTGIIYAATLVRPDKKIAEVKVKSVKKKFKDKSFAANCNREWIRSCETELDMPLDQMIEIALEGMREVADEIGL